MKDTKISKLIEQDGSIVFLKEVNLNFNIKTFVFQKYLSLELEDGFKICDPISLATNGKSYSLKYEYINEEEFIMNNTAAYLLGIYVAKLHNFCYDNASNISLPQKHILLGMAYWNDVLDSPEKEEALKMRTRIMSQLDDYDLSHVKIPLHRDLKLRNIIFDGIDFNLIDFDFAAVDDISIELGSFIVDMFYENIDAECIAEFISGYKSISKIHIDWSTIINNYLVYSCCSTFPFYIKDQISEQDFKDLITERNEKLNFTYLLKNTINENLQR